MASIGLKINHSTTGTDLAATLAKALAPNVTDAINVARLKSDLAKDDAYRTYMINKDIAERMEAKRKNFEHSVRIDTGPVRGQQILDAQALADEAPVAVAAPMEDPSIPIPYARPEAMPATLQPEAVAATEPPEVVGEPDWSYRVNQFPLRADAAPVPVEPTQILPELGQPALAGVPTGLQMLPDTAPAPTARPDNGWLADLLRPVGEVGNQVPPDITTPATQRMLAGMDAPAPIGEQLGPPQPPLPADYFTPPASLDLPPQPLTPPLPDTGALAGVPPELQPIPVGDPEVITLPGRPSVSPEATAAVPPAPAPAPAAPADPNAERLRAATGDVLPAGTPPPPAQTLPGRTVENSDGTVTHTTDRGSVKLSREDANKLGLAAAFATDAAGQTQKEAGTAALLYNRDLDISPEVRAATLAAGGSAVGKDTAAAVAGGEFEKAAQQAEKAKALDVSGTKKAEADAKAAAQKGEQDLRKEYTDRDETKRYVVMRDRFKDLMSSVAEETGTGDVAAVYAFVKMQDPTSSVMEGEQVTAQNAPGIAESVRAQLNSLLTDAKGGKFTPDGRKMLLNTGRNLYRNSAENQKKINDVYEKSGKEFGIDTSRVLIPVEDFTEVVDDKTSTAAPAADAATEDTVPPMPANFPAGEAVWKKMTPERRALWL